MQCPLPASGHSAYLCSRSPDTEFWCWIHCSCPGSVEASRDTPLPSHGRRVHRPPSCKWNRGLTRGSRGARNSVAAVRFPSRYAHQRPLSPGVGAHDENCDRRHSVSCVVFCESRPVGTELCVGASDENVWRLTVACLRLRRQSFGRCGLRARKPSNAFLFHVRLWEWHVSAARGRHWRQATTDGTYKELSVLKEGDIRDLYREAVRAHKQ